MSIALTLLLSTGVLAKMNKFTEFGSNPGNLTMYEYIPEGIQGSVPLVVALHGCTQSAAEYDQRSGWSQLAKEHGFIVIFPEQKSANNPAMCFNWGGEYGDQANLVRGQGENQSIAQMIETIKGKHDIEEDRIFITGFSAGGAFAAAMLSMYPDVFKAGSIMAGIPYRCATDLMSSFTCMYQSKSLPAQQWGDLVREAFDHSGDYPKISIWFGTSDYTVNPKNAAELTKQWGNIHGINSKETRVDLGDQNEHSYFVDQNGDKVIRIHRIIGMGHAITVDPNSEFSGGSTGSFSENKGIHSTLVTAEEWGILK